ncbi:MAG: hypothetical protein KJ725_20415 [Gammaproteobacteria bacterium]|nr:hypothetical protein [Gammaproteobacteria bacterium]
MSRKHAFLDGRCTLASCRRLNWHGWQVIGHCRPWGGGQTRAAMRQLTVVQLLTADQCLLNNN